MADDKGEWTQQTWDKIEAYSPKLRASLRRFTAIPEDAADAAQEAVRRALKASHDGLDEPKNVPAYMTMVGRNVLRGQSRKEIIPQTGEARAHSFQDEKAYYRFFSGIKDNSLNPLTAVQAQEVLKKLATIDRPHKEVFTLFYVNGLPVEEIAKMKKLPEGTVRSTIFRVREELKKKLDRPAPGRSSGV
jgi:RNA polymerase sigma-70 factor (ECF subfamily)